MLIKAQEQKKDLSKFVSSQKQNKDVLWFNEEKKKFFFFFQKHSIPRVKQTLEMQG